MTRARERAALATVVAGLSALGVASAGAAPTDKTAPVITREVTGPEGDDGWFRGPVNVRWTVSDPESPWTTSGCDAREVADETSGVTLECRASSAGGTSTDGLTVKVDATAPSITGATPDRPPDRRRWYHAPLSVTFAGDDTTSGIGSCAVVGYAGPDARRAAVTGSCRDAAGNESAPRTFRFRFDATPPGIIRARPSRRPDHRGWYAHPVRFRFRARDAVSGAARCTRTTYRGPDGVGAVRASCIDRAGNVATRDFRVRYDATPPAVALRVRPGDRMAMLRWRGAPDTRSYTLWRAIRGAPWTRTVVYRGRRHRHVDARLVNRQRYRYTLVAVDRAGHHTVRRATVRTRRALLWPRRHARLTAPPLLRWTPVHRARYYNVQLMRGGETILKAWPSRPRLRIPPTWSLDGRADTLVPGTYRWYVWPGIGRRTRHRYGPPIGHRRFVIVAPGGVPAPPPTLRSGAST